MEAVGVGGLVAADRLGLGTGPFGVATVPTETGEAVSTGDEKAVAVTL